MEEFLSRVLSGEATRKELVKGCQKLGVGSCSGTKEELTERIMDFLNQEDLDLEEVERSLSDEDESRPTKVKTCVDEGCATDEFCSVKSGRCLANRRGKFVLCFCRGMCDEGDLRSIYGDLESLQALKTSMGGEIFPVEKTPSKMVVRFINSRVNERETPLISQSSAKDIIESLERKVKRKLDLCELLRFVEEFWRHVNYEGSAFFDAVTLDLMKKTIRELRMQSLKALVKENIPVFVKVLDEEVLAEKNFDEEDFDEDMSEEELTPKRGIPFVGSEGVFFEDEGRVVGGERRVPFVGSQGTFFVDEPDDELFDEARSEGEEPVRLLFEDDEDEGEDFVDTGSMDEDFTSESESSESESENEGEDFTSESESENEFNFGSQVDF